MGGPEPEEGRAGRSGRPPLVSALRSGSELSRRAQALGFLSSGGVGAMGEPERPAAARPEEDEVKVAVAPSSAAGRVRPELRVLARLRSPDRRRRRPGTAGRKRPRCRLVGEGRGRRARSGLARDGGSPGVSCSGTLAGAAAALPSAAEERVCRCMRGQMTGGAARPAGRRPSCNGVLGVSVPSFTENEVLLCKVPRSLINLKLTYLSPLLLCYQRDEGDNAHKYHIRRVHSHLSYYCMVSSTPFWGGKYSKIFGIYE